MVSRDAPEVKLKGCFITCIGQGMEQSKITYPGRSLVPKLQLGNAGRKLQLPVRLEHQVVSTSPTTLQLPGRGGPKPELGNQL